MRLGWWLLAGAIGCGGGGAPPPDVVAGTRLRPVVVRPRGGGAALQIGWFDRLLGAHCTFREAADGRRRCLPEGESADAIGDPFFADPGCSQAVVEHRPGAPPFAFSPGRGVCGPRARAFRRGEVVMARGRFAQHEAHCDGGEGMPFPATAVTEVTGDTVAAALEADPPAGGLAVVRLATEDGARAFAYFRDEALGEPCHFGIDAGWRGTLGAADGLRRCLPLPRPWAVVPELFADAACSAPVVGASEEPCPPPRALALAPLTCPARAPVRRVGAPLSAWHRRDGAGCDPTPVPPGRSVHALGEEIPPAELPEGELRRPEGSGRLRAQALVTAAGRAPADWLWDDRLRTPCVPARTADGVLRCVPATGATFGPAFLDGQCRHRVAWAVPPGGCGARFAVSRAATGEVTGVAELGEPYDGPTYARGPERCEPRDAAIGALYRVGDEVPLDGLVALERVIE